MRFYLLSIFIIFSIYASLHADTSNSPIISITPLASVAEGNDGTTQVTLSITASECPNKKDITVDWYTSSGTAIEDIDFVKDDGTIVFSSADKVKQITIDLIGDETHEDDEIFYVNLQISSNSAQYYTRGDVVSTITILNDDSEPANTPPVIDSIHEQLATTNQPYSLDISTFTNDRDNNPIDLYTLSGVLPNGLSFDSLTGILSGTPDQNGTYTLSVYATDTDGDSNTISFDLIVSDSSITEIIYNADDMCYDTPTSDDICGVFSSMCTITTPIKNKTTDALTDVKIVLASTNLFEAFDDCGIDGSSGDCSDSSAMSMMSMSALNSGIFYDMPDYASQDTHTTYTKSSFSFMNTSYEWLGSYTKNGVSYQGKINPCGTVVANDPIFEACGIFPSALNTWDTIYSANNDEVIYADSVNANNGVDGIVGCSDQPLNPGDHSSPCDVGTLDMDPPGLPTFINSSLEDAYDASRFESDDEYGDVTIASGESVTFSSSTTYVDNDRKIMLMKSLTIHENTTVTFDAGDYYIGEWSSDKSLTVRANGEVRLYINGNMNLSDNFLDFNYDNDTGSPADMFIFVGGSFAMTSSGGGNGYNMVAFVFTNGTFDAGTNTNNSSFRGAITAVGSITLNNNQTYTYDIEGLEDNGFGDCDNIGHTPTLGRFDAWEGSISNRYITTKIVNKPFELTLASLTDDFNATLDRSGITVKYKLYDYDTNRTVTSGWSQWDITSGNPTAQKTFSDILEAYKDVRVRFKYCEEINTSVIFDYARCYDVGHQYYEEVSSSDNFAIRPDRFVLSSSESDMPDLLKAGSEYNISLGAYDYNYDGHDNINTINYNQIKTNLTINESKKLLNDLSESTSMHGSMSFGSLDFNITDGVSDNNASISFNDVGKVTLVLKDKNWANVDIDNANDPTPHECSSSGAYVCGEKDLRFIPHHFVVEDTNLTNNDANKDFTYLSNITDGNTSTYGMGAKIQLKVIAKDENNNTTQNFDSNSSLYENAISVNFTLNNPIYGDVATTTIQNALLGSFVKGEKTISRDESNLSQVLRFNFARTTNQPLNPFEIDGLDINLSISSTYSGTSSSSPITITGSKDGIDNGNAVFIYGRTHSPRQTFSVPDDSPYKTKIYYELYCFAKDFLNVDCNKSLVTPINSDLQRTDDIRWYLNKQHTYSNGNIGTLKQKNLSYITISNESQSANPYTANLTYNPSYGYPYKTTMENNASSWLIQSDTSSSETKNYFQVEFLKLGEWSGIYETNTTTKDNENIKTNSRIMW
ncbi:MAG: putative Ig domain-containing protein [Campylobacterales bacterium]|nr:putative Ig domain-containing protein [Campylobacterales bacterium]